MQLLVLVVLALASISTVSALACSATWECTSVSNDYNYVECMNGACVCKEALGFTGAATTASKCGCAAPNKVYWEGGAPYCIQYNHAVTYAQEQNRNDILISKINGVYTSPVWADAIDGTVRTGLLGSLFVENGTTIDLSFRVYAPDLSTYLFSYDLDQTGLWSLNQDNLLQSVALVISNLGWVSDPFFPEISATREGLCNIIVNVARCTAAHDPTGYYSTVADCVNFLSPLNFEAVTCRQHHAILAMTQPEISCPLTGKASPQC